MLILVRRLSVDILVIFVRNVLVHRHIRLVEKVFGIHTCLSIPFLEIWHEIVGYTIIKWCDGRLSIYRKALHILFIRHSAHNLQLKLSKANGNQIYLACLSIYFLRVDGQGTQPFVPLAQHIRIMSRVKSSVISSHNVRQETVIDSLTGTVFKIPLVRLAGCNEKPVNNIRCELFKLWILWKYKLPVSTSRYKYIIRCCPRATSAVARICDNDNLPFFPDTVTDFSEKKVYLIIDKMVFTFVDPCIVFYLGIERNPRLIPRIVLISILIWDLLTVPRKMYIHYVPRFAVRHKTLKSTKNICLSSLSIFQLDNTVFCEPLSRQSLFYNIYIVVAMNCAPPRILWVVASTYQQCTPSLSPSLTWDEAQEYKRYEPKPRMHNIFIKSG